MHYSLRVWFNVVLIGSWGCLAILGFGLTRPVPWLQVTIGLFAGVFAGVATRRNLREFGADLKVAPTLRAITRIRARSTPGRLPVYLFWLATLTIGIAAALTHGWNSLEFWASLLSGTGVFWVTNDVAAFPEIVRLGQ
jgi:hypothetical protein